MTTVTPVSAVNVTVTTDGKPPGHTSDPLFISLVEDDGAVDVLRDIVVPKKFYNRLSLGVQVLDEVFGGMDFPGVMRGATYLLTGSPGAGKSTMCLQLADLLQQKGGQNVLYNIGEESKYMIKMRADRIGLKGEFCITQKTDVDDVIKFARETGVEVLFQDSLQSLKSGDLSGPRLQKTIVKKLHTFAKESDTTVVIVGHITKAGGFAGPQELKHDVDGHAHLHMNKDTGNRIFELQKNRFGPAGMPYEFTLSANGLDFSAVVETDPKELPKSQRGKDRQTEIVNLIKEKLLAGEALSGYCFERLEVDCSGGYWRGMLVKASKELQAAGHRVLERVVDRRAHIYVEGV